MWKTPSVLIAIVLLLLALGIVMLASTSGIKAAALYDDPYFFVKRQAIWMALAGLACWVTAHFNYRYWRYLAPPLFIVSIVLLVLVLVPGIGVKVGGSRRWFHLGYFSFQPSEFGKFTLILMLAWWMAREKWRVGEFWRGTVMPLGFLGGMIGLVFVEPDFGTTLLCAIVGILILYVGGARIWYLMVFAAVGLTGFALAVMHDPVRWNRIKAFLDPEQYAMTYSFQLLNAINAFIAGGITGVGLGGSIQKHYYLPEAHTDFIFAIIGEELGLAATFLVVLLFAGLFFCGLRISLRAADNFGRNIAFGITMMITLQALINIGVVIGCLPTKGLPLPFISAGGSSLIVSLLQIGILLNIALQGRKPDVLPERPAIKDRVHNF